MPAIIQENFTFIVIALAIIVIFMVAYFTFIRPKRKNSRKSRLQNQESFLKEDENNLHRETFDKSTYLKSSKGKMKTKHKDEENQTTDAEDQEEKDKEEQTKDDLEKENQSENDNEFEENTEDEEPKEFGKYHVLFREKDDRWYVKREGSDKTLRVLHTKKEAIAWATIKAINQDTNIVIHNKEGKIEKHGY